jgi:hypothetical protein
MSKRNDTRQPDRRTNRMLDVNAITNVLVLRQLQASAQTPADITATVRGTYRTRRYRVSCSLTSRQQLT